MTREDILRAYGVDYKDIGAMMKWARRRNTPDKHLMIHCAMIVAWWVESQENKVEAVELAFGVVADLIAGDIRNMPATGSAQ
jgi:hypothetical protein